LRCRERPASTESAAAMTAPDPFAGTLEAIAVIVARRVVDELRPLLVAATASPSTPAARATLDDLARLESCSRATIRRLVAEGAPVTHIGQSPRFDVQAFRAWLDARGRKGTTAKPSSGPIAGVRLLSRRAK
jgi:hypothetical protein